jgi:hypothetical protein
LDAVKSGSGVTPSAIIDDRFDSDPLTIFDPAPAKLTHEKTRQSGIAMLAGVWPEITDRRNHCVRSQARPAPHT